MNFLKFETKTLRFFSLGLVLLLSLSYSFSQEITVIDQVSYNPIADVLITNSSRTKTVFTNTNGKATLDDFDTNELLFFKKLSYENITLTKSEITTNNHIVYLFVTVENLNEIVVSASKFKQIKSDVPQRIVGISAKQIAIVNPQTSADLLDNTGRVFIQKSQMGGGSPMIRGFSTNRLLISVDGVRMNNAIFRGGNLQNVISIDPFNIHNTEVTLGAGAVIYGSDAIGGVMSFYTKSPQLSYNDSTYIAGSATARFASANNEKTGHFNINLGYKKWGFLSSVSYTDFDDLRMGNNGPDDYLRLSYVVRQNGQDVIVPNPNPKVQNPTGYHQINVMQKIRFEAKENLNFDLGLHYTTTSDYPRYDRLLRPDNSGTGFRSAEWNYGPQEWLMSNFQITNSNKNSLLYEKLQSNIAYQSFKESREVRDFGSDLREIRSEQVDVWSFNIDLEKRLTKNTTLFYGAEYLYNKVNSTGREENIVTNTSVPNVTRYPDGATWQSLAVYSSLKYKPSSKFVLQTGLRFNQIIAEANFEANNRFLNLPFESTEVNNGALTGTAGISWSPSEIIQWRLNASTAFRSPNIDDLGKVFDSEPGAVVVPNNELKPEYSVGGELGVKLNFNDKLIIDVGTFYTFLDNALTRRDFELNGQTEIVYDGALSNIQAIQNSSKAWIYGLEAGIQINFSERLKFNSQYNIIGGSEENDGIETPVRHVAPNFGRSHFTYTYKKLNLDAFLVYNNSLPFNRLAPSELSKDYFYALDANGNPYSPSWYTLNLRSQYQLTEQLMLVATLENITDQRYRPYSSGISGAGRNLILSATYNF